MAPWRSCTAPVSGWLHYADHGVAPMCRSSTRAGGQFLVSLDKWSGGQGRLIPADAGNTGLSADVCRVRAVHPRGRGEHPRATANAVNAAGSSPRTRGTRVAQLLDHGGERFIPADAGNTPPCRRSSPAASVHPRGRGEHSEQRAAKHGNYGSSPRTRGTLHAANREVLERRFIPADAGNTLPDAHGVLILTVHPRGRGEHWRGSS